MKVSEGDDWESKMDECDAKLEALGLNLDVVYSAWGKDSQGNPVYNLNEVAVKGKVRIIAQADEFFGGSKSKNYRSRVLTNPTWLTLFKHADKAMKRTLDEHHCFFEGFEIVEDSDDVTEIELVMGS